MNELFFYKEGLLKPDGRRLWLYSTRAITNVAAAPSPQREPLKQLPHFRWNRLRREWVSFASYRQNRTFLPPPEYNPLKPMTDPHVPTELPTGDYEVAVFDNLFPAMKTGPEGFDPGATDRPSGGACEVVVFSQDPQGSLGTQSVERIALIIRVWADRTRELSRDPGIKYVMPFENKGVEMGVTLHHPHGQIYAYPFIPPIPERELESQKIYFEENPGRTLLGAILADELANGERVVLETPTAAAFVPEAARYPYEVWLVPKKPAQNLHELAAGEIDDLASALKKLLMKFDGLWKKPFPYLMVLSQGPVNGAPAPYAHLHFKFYPPLRTADRLKYLAGTELGAGMFANDCLPESTAQALREVQV